MERIWLLIAIWGGGTLLRIWRQARFFQLEGYMTSRYLRWLAARPGRIVVVRALVFSALAGLAAIIIDLTGQDREGVYLIVWGVAGILAVWPERFKEVKQKFTLTQRARAADHGVRSGARGPVGGGCGGAGAVALNPAAEYAGDGGGRGRTTSRRSAYRWRT